MLAKLYHWVALFSVGQAVLLLVGCSVSSAKPPEVEQKQYNGWTLEFFNNSTTMSQILAINSQGAVMGFKESGPNLTHVYFYYDGKSLKNMPKPKGFTVVEGTAISDTGVVVGHAMKSIGSSGSLRALVWSPDREEMTLLPVPDGDSIADATDVSADGKLVTGYTTGPQRLRPAIWRWNESQGEWRVEVLPTEHENNPYLMSSHLITSPNGQTIAGCCTEKILPDGTVDSALYVWRQVDGKWTRQLVNTEQLYVKGMNNKGQIAGSVVGDQGRLPCLATLEGELKKLELVTNDVAGEARDINEQSIVVGWCDDPVGSDGGPTPCTWNLAGEVTPMKINEFGLGLLYAINDQGQIAGAAEVISKPATSDTANDEQSALLGVKITK